MDRFVRELLELSESLDYELALEEWEETDIFKSDDPHVCLCGKTDIHDVRVITNKLNGNETIVGNECINKIGCSHIPASVFAQITTLKNNATGNYPIGYDLIEISFDVGVITVAERKFLKSVSGKSNYSFKQRKWKRSIAKKIFFVFTGNQLY